MSDPLVQTVVAALAEVKHVPPEQITLDTTFAELGMDSLDTVTMLFELEQARFVFDASPRLTIID